MMLHFNRSMQMYMCTHTHTHTHTHNSRVITEHNLMTGCNHAKADSYELTLRCIIPNCTLHRWQTSPSAHSGAVSAENIASLSFSAGNL